MNGIGRHYQREHYNCAHFVADWYREKLGITIPTGNVWDLSFVYWLRRNFKQSPKPVENCMVVMTGLGTRHIGVYADHGVYHNYQIGDRPGAVVQWTVGQIKRNYNEVTYWIWSQ